METNSNSVRQKNSNAKKPFQTPQTASRANDHWTHQDSLFNDSLRRSLTKSADRYIPSRSAANTDFIRAVFDRKIQNAKAKSENAPFGNEDQNRQDIKIQNKLSLSPDLKKDRGTTAEVERSPSLENTSLSEKAEESGPNEASFASARGVGNEDSFNLSFLAAQRRVSKTGSPCGETSKSASKRVRSELNCDAFFGAKGRVDILKFKQSIQSIDTTIKPKIQRPFSEREKMDERSSKIAKSAEKVLDAPDIIKSSALNLLSWVYAENSDVLAVALANEVYFWFVAKNQIKQLSSLVVNEPDQNDNINCDNNCNNGSAAEELSLIGSVLWFGSGFFAVGTAAAQISIYAFQNHFKNDDSPVTRTHQIALNGPKSMVTALSWGRRRKLLVAAQRDGTVTLHRFLGARSSLVARLGLPAAQVCRFHWSPLGDALVAGARDGRAYVFAESHVARSAVPISPVAVLAPEPKSGNCGGFFRFYGDTENTPSNRPKNGKIEIKNRENEIKTGEIEKMASVKAAEWCPWESHVVALGRSDGSVSIYDLSGFFTSSESKNSRFPPSFTASVSKYHPFSDSSSRSASISTLVSSSASITAPNARFPDFRVKNGENSLFSAVLRQNPLRSVSGGRRAVTGLAFLPQHKELLTAHAEGVLQLWSCPEMTVLAELRGHSRAVLGLALSAGRGLAASAACDETVRVWRVGGEAGGDCGGVGRRDGDARAVVSVVGVR